MAHPMSLVLTFCGLHKNIMPIYEVARNFNKLGIVENVNPNPKTQDVQKGCTSGRKMHNVKKGRSSGRRK
jgi:hypothetical protein